MPILRVVGGKLFASKNSCAGGYVYGFNGMEGDPEVYGDGNAYTTEFRQLDTRLGRWWSIDPMVAQLPWQSPYNSMDNNPVRIIDPKGLYGTEAEAKQMQNEAKENGYEVGEIYQSGDEYGFASSIDDGEWEHNFTKDYFGVEGQEVHDGAEVGTDPIFENPIMRIQGTIQARNQIKDFFKGESDKNVYYKPSSSFSKMMINSPGVKHAINDFVKEGKTKKGYYISPDLKNWDALVSSIPSFIEGHLDFILNSNLPRLSVGSYTAVISKTTNKDIIRIHLINNMSLGSLGAHIEWFYENSPEKGPFSTVNMKIDLGLFDIKKSRFNEDGSLQYR